MRNKLIPTGILTLKNGTAFLQGSNGKRYFSDAAVWSGYLKHWESMELCGELLAETDYTTGKRIALLWPKAAPGEEPFIELYYNERLTRYFYSYFGHTAININGEIFNFSHLIQECEVMNEAAYFYRPALGKFAPKPGIGYCIDNPELPYLDKFGRQFMRTIHVARITGHDTSRLSKLLHSELEKIYSTPEDPDRPGVYRDFSVLTNSCSTIIRDALRLSGFPWIGGIFPREVFTSAVWNFLKKHDGGDLKLSVFTRPQIIVDEAPVSAMSPLLNPLNIVRRLRLKMRGIII